MDRHLPQPIPFPVCGWKTFFVFCLDLHKSLVCTALRGKLGVFSEMEANFKNLSRGLVNVAAKLTHNKDVRDLFVDLVEKFVEPCRSDHWPLKDVQLFLNQYSASVHSLDGFR